MYEEHFGLTGRPFQLTPDPHFWYETATHRKAMAYLGYGLAQGEGFIVVTGDIGAGKTTLIGHLTDHLDPAALNVVKLVSTAIEADDLLRIVATALGVDPDGLTKAQLLTVIERGLHAVARTGRRTLLVVDEAQALPVSALEELRMLSNFQAGGHALVQIILLGQPEFRDRLHGEDRLEQLRQRVIAIHHLEPMENDEVADYIAHRLTLVGWQGNPDFAADAFIALFQGSDGVPRRLNQLASRVMLHAAVEDIALIDGRVVRTVLRDLHADLPLLAIDRRAPKPTAPPVPAEPVPVIEPEILEAASVVAQSVADPSTARSFVPRTARWLVIDPETDRDSSEPQPDPEIDAEPVTPEPAAPPVRGWFVPVHPPSTVVAEPALELDQPVPLEPEPQPQPQPEPEPEPEAPAEPDAATADTPSIDTARLAALEARIEQQDAALRRVLTLLVDWVEGEAKGPPPGLAVVADDTDAAQPYARIRGAAAWDDAA